MSTGRGKVFLSYRRADTQHAAGRAADKLADRFELFMDIDTIPPGVDFTDYLKRAVGGCDVLLAFIGDRWAGLTDETGRRRLDDPHDWVVAEIATALAREVPVIPVLVDGADLPMADQLPEQLRPLAMRQATRLRFESFSADLAHLVAAIEHVVPSDADREPTAVAPPAKNGPFADRWNQEPKPHKRTPVGLTVPARRRLAPAIVGGVLAIAIGAGAWAMLGRGQASSATPSVAPATAASLPASATPLPTVAPATTVALLKLRVPAAIRPSCRKLAPSDKVLVRNLVVALQCSPTKSDPGRPRYAFYFQYADTRAAQVAFRDYYASDKPGPGDCTAEPGEVLDDRVAGSPFGVLRCYRDADGYRVFAWISPEQSIVASAADQDRSFAELFAWWSGAGPTVG